MRALVVMAAFLAALLPACGDGDDEPAGAGTTATTGTMAISIDQALASDSKEPLLVSGNLVVTFNDVRLCSALAESFPPQCGGASVHVDGLDLAEVDGLITEGDVSWTDRPIELRGVVEKHLLEGKTDILTVSENAAE
jgi:hypothetical protein